jgi:hypothetical protein
MFMEISTEAHCGAFKSTRLIIQMYLGLASSWISITKNLVAFEEKNCKKRGQEITIGKKLFMFLKVIFFGSWDIANFILRCRDLGNQVKNNPRI